MQNFEIGQHTMDFIKKLQILMARSSGYLFCGPWALVMFCWVKVVLLLLLE